MYRLCNRWLDEKVCVWESWCARGVDSGATVHRLTRPVRRLKKGPILLVFQKRPHSTILLVFVSFLKIKGQIYLEHFCFDRLFECQMELKLQVNYIFDEFSEQRYMEIYD